MLISETSVDLRSAFEAVVSVHIIIILDVICFTVVRTSNVNFFRSLSALEEFAYRQTLKGVKTFRDEFCSSSHNKRFDPYCLDVVKLEHSPVQLMPTRAIASSTASLADFSMSNSDLLVPPLIRKWYFGDGR